MGIYGEKWTSERFNKVKKAMSRLAGDAQKSGSTYIMTDKEMNDMFDAYFGDVIAKANSVSRER